MRFQVERSLLINAARYAASVTPTRDASILSCLKIKADGNVLHLTGTNNETWCVARCEASTSEAGATSTNAADLIAAIGGMDAVINGSLSNAGIRLSSGRTSITLPTLSVAFPASEKPDCPHEIDGGVEAIKDCLPFACKDQNRPSAMGVNFSDGMACAMDGAQLFIRPAAGGEGQTVPVGAASIIIKTGGRLFLGERMWRVEAQDRVSFGKILDRGFPDWTRLTFDSEPFCTCEAADLLRAIRSVTFGRAQHCVFENTQDGINVKGDSFRGLHIDGSAFLSCEGGGDIVFVTSQIVNCLEAMGDAVVDISANDRLIKIAPKASGHFAIVSMMRDHRNNIPVAA